MKKIFLLFTCIIAGIYTYAQTDPLREKLDSIFQYINKSQIPGGYLKEYGSQMLPLHCFNGILTDSNNVENLSIFRYIYADLYTAKLPTQSIPPVEARIFLPRTLPSLPQVNDKLDTVRLNATSSVAILYGQYSSLKPTALDENLFTLSNEQLYDVADRPSSPYINNTLFAAAAIGQKYINTVNLRYDSSLYYSNTNLSVSALSIDFLDGNGYQTITTAGISKTYSDSSGNKPVVYKAVMNNGDTVYCKGSIQVKVTQNNLLRYTDTDAFAREIPISSLTANSGAFNDVQDKLQIRYAVNNPTRSLPAAQRLVRKPLIYVEGYDVEGDYDIYDLIRFGSSTEQPGEWINLAGINNGYDFMHDLDDVAGYDLIFVNYNTLRSIPTNALMLQQVIEWANAQKAQAGSTEKNAVLGVSAGGLVARYCLSNMTKNIGYNSTDTKILITHDSPHQGANVPLALQHFLYDLAYTKVLGNMIIDKEEKLKQFIQLNSAPATAQLLRARVIDENNNVVLNSFLSGAASPYQQMVNLTPAQRPYKFVATAQGSQCGLPVFQGSNITMASEDDYFAVLFLLPFWKMYRLKTTMKSVPESGIEMIESYKMEARISIFGIGFRWKTVKGNADKYNPSGYNGWDNAPGSTQSIMSRTKRALIGGLQPIHNAIPPPFLFVAAGVRLNIYQDLFSFVSTTSALDATPGISPYTPFNYFINGNSNTGTDKFIAQEKQGNDYNIEHTNYTTRNARWIFNEMQDQTQSVTCLDYCTTNEIIGPAAFCGSSSFSINLPPGSTINWSISPNPNSIVTSSANGNTLFLTQQAVSNPLLGNSGEVTITANYTSSCGNGAISKIVFVGVRTPEIAMTGLCGGGFEAMAIPNSYGQNYNWYADGVLQAHHGYKIRVLNFTNPYPIIGLQIVSPNCGTSQVRYENAYCPESPIANFMVSPVPSKNNITVTGIDGFTFSSIMIVDKIGNIKKLLKFPNNTKNTNINISDLPNDIYYIKVLSGKEWVGKSMSVQ